MDFLYSKRMKQILIIAVAAITKILTTIYTRKFKEIMRNSNNEIMFVSSVAQSIFALFFREKRNIGASKSTILNSIIFFLHLKLNVVGLPLIKATLATILTQPRILVVCFLSVIFLKKRLKKFEIFGIILIIIGMMMKEEDDKTKTNTNHFFGCLLVFSSSILNGIALFNFDYFIRSSVVDTWDYFFVSQLSSTVLNILYSTFISFYFQQILFRDFFDPKFLFLSATFTFNIFSMITMSFNFDLIPRLITTLIIQIFGDFWADIVLDQKLKFYVIFKYFLCVAGVLFYQLGDIALKKLRGK